MLETIYTAQLNLLVKLDRIKPWKSLDKGINS